MAKVKKKANTMGLWVYRLLVVVLGAGMVYSWLQPWWTIDGLNERLGDFVIFLKGSEMPAWFAAFMWTYLGLCMVALLAGLWIKSGHKFGIGKIKIELNELLVGGVGLSYIIVGIVAAVFAGIP